MGQKSLKIFLPQNPRTKCPVLGCKLGRIRPENGTAVPETCRWESSFENGLLMPQNALMKCLQKKEIQDTVALNTVSKMNSCFKTDHSSKLCKTQSEAAWQGHFALWEYFVWWCAVSLVSALGFCLINLFCCDDDYSCFHWSICSTIQQTSLLRATQKISLWTKPVGVPAARGCKGRGWIHLGYQVKTSIVS